MSDDLAMNELAAVVAKLRGKALNKRQAADNVRGQIADLQKRLTSYEADAALFETSADRLEALGEHV